MKAIKAYVSQVRSTDVIDALGQLEGVAAIAVVPMQEYGHSVEDGTLQKLDMIKLEVDATDDHMESVVDCIVEQGRTGSGHPSDGKVFVSELVEAVRISDGARGAGVL